jgi:DNA-binding response OmpR family regulator
MNESKISQPGERIGALHSCEGSPPRRILVVDDEPVIRRINAMVLDHAGYYVDTAEDGASAWESLKSGHYDLMITDNNMPNLTGMELLKKLYATRMTLPFIMATGKMPEEEFTRCPWLQHGATLLKPYAAEELLEVVKKVLCEADGAATGPQAFRGEDLKVKKTGQTAEPARVPVQCRTKPPHRILIVENEPDLRRLNAEVLESSGYQVDTAKDGQAGWKALHATRHAPESYALLITDHDMPGLAGLELVKKVRAARMCLPVIVATRTLPAEDLINLYPWLQPAAALVKPYSTVQLLGTVEAVLRAADGSDEQIAPPPNRPSDDSLSL